MTTPWLSFLSPTACSGSSLSQASQLRQAINPRLPDFLKFQIAAWLEVFGLVQARLCGGSEDSAPHESLIPYAICFAGNTAAPAQ